jgi:hypothetical protein
MHGNKDYILEVECIRRIFSPSANFGPIHRLDKHGISKIT